jgi:hypothetical protein
MQKEHQFGELNHLQEPNGFYEKETKNLKEELCQREK